MYDEVSSTRRKIRLGNLFVSTRFYDMLSEKLLHQFVEYMQNRRMRGIQLSPVYEQKQILYRG